MSVGDWNDANGSGTDCCSGGHFCFIIKLANCTTVFGFDISTVTDFESDHTSIASDHSSFDSYHSSIEIDSWSWYLSIELDGQVWTFSRRGGQFCSSCSNICGHSAPISAATLPPTHPVQLWVCPSSYLQALQQNPWQRGPREWWWGQPIRLHGSWFQLLHQPLAVISKSSYLLESLMWLEHKQLLVHTCMSIFLHLSKIATYAGQTLQKIT